MPDIISTWDADFRPIQQEIELGIACVAGGKAVRQPMKQEDRQQCGTITGLNVRNGLTQRKPSYQVNNNNILRPAISPARSEHSPDPPSPDPEARPRILSVPSQNSLALSTPNYILPTARSPSPNEFYTPYAPAGPRPDYFSRDRLPSTSSLSSIAANKKKPPPPPVKRTPSNRDVWVTALYDFAGQGQGDLVFREGDQIRVVKKTGSTDDWWEGELKGVQGSFPANYCQAV